MIESVVVFNCFVEVMLCSISLLSRSITCPTALQSTSLHLLSRNRATSCWNLARRFDISRLRFCFLLCLVFL